MPKGQKPSKPSAKAAAPKPKATPFVQLPREERSRIKINEQKAANKALAEKAAATRSMFPPPAPPPPPAPTKAAKTLGIVKKVAKKSKPYAVVAGVLGAIGAGLDYTKNAEYATPAKTPTKPTAAPSNAKKEPRKSKLGTSTRPK